MECGTIESHTILSVAKTAQALEEAHGVTFVDAPVSGGPMGAEKATLTFMVGCAPSASATVFPLVKDHLRHMGNPEGIFLCGDVGAGTAFKVRTADYYYQSIIESHTLSLGEGTNTRLDGVV
jgi:3-hydroxyisobutyrate dehydrogenase